MQKNFIQVHLNVEHACPGDTINAVVYLRISKAYDNAKFVCDIHGREETRLTLTQSYVIKKLKNYTFSFFDFFRYIKASDSIHVSIALTRRTSSGMRSC